jgi:hypothetical protein
MKSSETGKRKPLMHLLDVVVVVIQILCFARKFYVKILKDKPPIYFMP